METIVELVRDRLEDARSRVRSGVRASKVFEEVMKVASPPPAGRTVEMPPPAAGTPSRGPAKAKVLLHVFADYQCPFSARLMPVLEDFQKGMGTGVRLIWHDLPLTVHPQAMLAAEAAREAFAQQGEAGFWRYNVALFAAQKEPQGLEQPHLEALAQEQGLDLQRFHDALQTHLHQSAIQADVALANGLQITGTPSSVLGNQFVSGYQPVGAFTKALRHNMKH
jgi:protein-disulfide isomerase